MSSRDGVRWENDTQWSDKAADDDNVLFAVAFGQGKFVAAGGGAKVGHLLVTRDGKAWRELPERKGRVATVAFGKTAGGDERWVAGNNDRFLYSADGEAWKEAANLGLKGSVHFRKSAYGNGRFVSIGDWDPWGKTRIQFRAVTPDGERLAHVDPDAAPARSIAFGAGRFVVVGPGGVRESSADGEHWEHRATDPGADSSSVVWDGKRFVAAGGKFAYTSPDGVEWKQEAKGIPCTVLYAAEGNYLGGSWAGNVWHSADGLDWKKVMSGPGNSVEAIAFGSPGKD